MIRRAPARRGLGLLAAGALLAGCASTPVAPREALVRRRCGGCHAVPGPGPARAEERLASLARHRMSLTPEERAEIERHLRGEPLGAGAGPSP